MKIIKLINEVNIQSIKETSNKYGVNVSIKDKPKLIKGRHKVIEIEGNTDNILLFSRELKGLNINNHLFSDIHVDCSGMIKAIKRAFKKGYKYNNKIFYSISDLKAFLKETQNTSSIKRSKQHVVKRIIY